VNSLSIWIEGEKAATLLHDEGRFEFAYLADWITSGGYAISPHLPMGDTSHSTNVTHFFSNLLPEGELLEGLSQKHQVSKFDVFGLLKKVGRDCAGALVIAESAPLVADEEPQYTHISDAELNQQIIDSRNAQVPLMFWAGKPRMSLAGVQNKLGVFVRSDEQLMLPTQGQPTSHILKIGTARYPGMAANEYFCMQLAQAIGLPAADTKFRKLPEPVLLVHRYDRLWQGDGGARIKRQHQIDACQALNLPPNHKYEEPAYEYAAAGATLADIVGLAKLCDTASAAQITILNWILFNYLIGNTDAHAKNISFLVNRSSSNARMLGRTASIAVAPFYDLVCGSVYGLNDFAQRVGGEDNLVLIGAKNWDAFAKEVGVAPKLVKRLGEMLLKQLSKKIDGIVEAVAVETSEEIVRKIDAQIRGQAKALTESLANL
jgi:serine/threonine-protein kinase HipA